MAPEWSVALSWLSPLRRSAAGPRIPPPPAVGQKALRLIPALSLIFGCLAGFLAWLCSLLPMPSAVSGILVLTALLWVTGGRQLIAFATTVDSLLPRFSRASTRQSHHPDETPQGDHRPSAPSYRGIALLVLSLLTQAAAFGVLTMHHGYFLIAAIVALARWNLPFMCAEKATPPPPRRSDAAFVGTQPATFGWILNIAGLFLFAITTAVSASLSGNMPDVALIVSLLGQMGIIEVLVSFRQRCVAVHGFLTRQHLHAATELHQLLGALIAVAAVTLQLG